LYGKINIIGQAISRLDADSTSSEDNLEMLTFNDYPSPDHDLRCPKRRDEISDVVFAAKMWVGEGVFSHILDYLAHILRTGLQ
jgi:hypothetical protein